MISRKLEEDAFSGTCCGAVRAVVKNRNMKKTKVGTIMAGSFLFTKGNIHHSTFNEILEKTDESFFTNRGHLVTLYQCH